LEPARRFFLFWEWAVRSFMDNRCPSRAAGLAYTTLLALIPMLAFGVSVSTSLLKKDGEQIIEDLIDRGVARVAPQLDLMPIPDSSNSEGEGLAPSETRTDSQRKEVVRKIMESIQNVQSGTLGASSIIILLLVAISMLRNVEFSFNDIWGISTGRSWMISIVNYWAFISLGPLILAALIGSRTVLFDRVQSWLGPFGGMLILSLFFINTCPIPTCNGGRLSWAPS
jgi:membrane protein